MLNYASLQPNCSYTGHSHPLEQVGITIEGELKVTIGNETRFCQKGDAFVIPSNIEHGA